MDELVRELALAIGKFTWAEKSGLSIEDRWKLLSLIDAKMTSISFLLDCEKTRAITFMEKEAV